MMPNSDPRDRFVHPYLTRMIFYFLPNSLCQRLNYMYLQFYLKIRCSFTSATLFFTSFSDALVTFVSNQVTITTNVKHRSEQQG